MSQPEAVKDNPRHARSAQRRIRFSLKGRETAPRCAFSTCATRTTSTGTHARSCSNDHDAEDVVQQVFTRVLTAIETYELRSVPFSAWLLRITHNLAIDYVRRRRPIVDDAEASLAEERPQLEADHLRGHAARRARRAARGPARDRRAAPPGGLLARRDRGAARSFGGLRSRPAPPRPPGAPGSAHARGRVASTMAA